MTNKEIIFSFLLTGICLFAFSCSKSITDEPESTPLQFDTNYAQWSLTRGVDYTGNAGLNPIPDMLVYGYYTGTKTWMEERTPAFPLFMSPTEVTNMGGSWVYNPIQYFYPTGYHTFFAFAPYQLLEADSRNDFYFPSYSETPALKYHLPNDITNQRDLLIGWATDIVNGTNPVEIEFRHITTKITFSARKADGYSPNVRINSIVLNNIYAEGVANINEVDGSLSVSWNNHNDLRTFSFTTANNFLKNINLSTTFQSLSDQNLYIIPQGIRAGNTPTGTSITISTIEVIGDVERQFTKTLNLGAMTWKPGESLNFQIVYSGDGTEILLLVDPGTGDPSELTPIS